MRLPIAFPHIKDMPDQELVPAIKSYREVETSEFFYGKSCPAFISLFNRYYTDSADVLDFIHEVYVDIVQKQQKTKNRKIDTFRYEASFKNWVAFVALRMCQMKFKRRGVFRIMDCDEPQEAGLSVLSESSLLNRKDVEVIIGLMPNKRYQEIIRLHYLEGKSLEETAAIMNMDLANFYNKHRLAKVQYLVAYNKEISR